ncbi:EF-P lysine aminoacylase EpmA [Candidatus Methylospira mobilis]|nr:EF-P lysine aminoacylase EpmA [Candidatus Methylospira mobilis]WNV06783.1 EF-P lysine aminoacylase EpmA [Candidatus Methylospira mobilis]
MLADIRVFFSNRGVLEVETPLMCQTAATDPGLSIFVTQLACSGENNPQARYLQTSPEYAMKRLLAAGSGAIYQITRAFRNEESGRFHNPEFSLLEWYRPGFSLGELIAEIDALIRSLFDAASPLQPSATVDYRQLFDAHTGLDALTFDPDAYNACALSYGLVDAARLCGDQHGHWLDFLFSVRVQPTLGKQGVCFVHNYPAVLPSLARNKIDDSRVVERVEIFMDGIEIGNGFRELTDHREQRARFENDLAERTRRGLPSIPIDARLLQALEHGLPDCSGVAIGLDRLLMLLTGETHIDQVLAFADGRA